MWFILFPKYPTSHRVSPGSEYWMLKFQFCAIGQSGSGSQPDISTALAFSALIVFGGIPPESGYWPG